MKTKVKIAIILMLFSCDLLIGVPPRKISVDKLQLTGLDNVKIFGSDSTGTLMDNSKILKRIDSLVPYEGAVKDLILVDKTIRLKYGAYGYSYLNGSSLSLEGKNSGYDYSTSLFSEGIYVKKVGSVEQTNIGANYISFGGPSNYSDVKKGLSLNIDGISFMRKNGLGWRQHIIIQPTSNINNSAKDGTYSYLYLPYKSGTLATTRDIPVYKAGNNIVIDNSIPLRPVVSADVSGKADKTYVDLQDATKLSAGVYTGTASDLNNDIIKIDSLKVDRITGKTLTTNDFTDVLKTKLEGITEGAEVNVQSDWNQTNSSADDFIKNKPIVVRTVGGATPNYQSGDVYMGRYFGRWQHVVTGNLFYASRFYRNFSKSPSKNIVALNGDSNVSNIGEAGVAVGYGAMAGYKAVAIGSSAGAGGYSVVVGNNASGNSNVIVIGNNARSGSSITRNSIAIGGNTYSQSGIAIGERARANANYPGEFSIAIGEDSSAEVYTSMAIGKKAKAYSKGEIAIGEGTTYTPTCSLCFDENDRLFNVGYNGQNDFLQILKSGKASLPQTDLADITGDKDIVTKEYVDAHTKKIALSDTDTLYVHNEKYISTDVMGMGQPDGGYLLRINGNGWANPAEIYLNKNLVALGTSKDGNITRLTSQGDAIKLQSVKKSSTGQEVKSEVVVDSTGVTLSNLLRVKATVLPSSLTADERIIVLDSSDNKLKFWDGTAWHNLY